jgi:hypothetical protein
VKLVALSDVSMHNQQPHHFALAFHDPFITHGHVYHLFELYWHISRTSLAGTNESFVCSSQIE